MKGYATLSPLMISILFTLGLLMYFSIFHHRPMFIEGISSKESFLQKHRHIIPLTTIEQEGDNLQNTNQGKKGDSESIQSSPYAYITLLHGIDDSFKYRGYLYNIMIMKTALQSLGSTADFLVMIGFSFNTNHELFQPDLDKLTAIGIKLIILPRYLNTEKVNFAEMALLKITPWSLTQYKKIQFFDGDIMPIMNMDCYFNLDQNTFNVGNASPLNSGWFLAIPNMNDYEALKAKALKRLNEPWDREIGWGEAIPSWLKNSRGKSFPDWNFNGASLDQGLLTHYFVINNGRVVLINRNEMIQYNGLNKQSQTVTNLLASCQSRLPTSAFAHFTGKTKPWLTAITDKSRRDVKIWGKYLDQLHLDGVNSTNIHEQGLKPPLGYFHPNN